MVRKIDQEKHGWNELVRDGFANIEKYTIGTIAIYDGWSESSMMVENSCNFAQVFKLISRPPWMAKISYHHSISIERDIQAFQH